MSTSRSFHLGIAGTVAAAICIMGPVAFAPVASGLEPPVCPPTISLAQGATPTQVNYTVSASGALGCGIAYFSFGSDGGQVDPGDSMSGTLTVSCATRISGTINEANGFGTASAEIMSGIYPPSKPDAPALVEATPSSIRAAWSANLDQCRPIDSFVLQTSSGASLATTDAAGTLTGLAAGTSYSVYVTAKNSAGTSSPSTAVAMATKANPTLVVTKPSAPQGLAISNIVATGARATWAPPAAPGSSPVTSYIVTLNGKVVGQSAATAQDFTGLTASTNYTVTVTAVSAAGNGTAASVGFRTAAATPTPVRTTTPAAVVNLQVSSLSATQVTLAWNTPATDGGSAITGYTVTNATTKEVRPVAANVLQTQFAATASTAYVFTVQAINANGPGPAATITTTTPSAAAPDKASQTITVAAASGGAWKSGKAHYVGKAKSSAGNKVVWTAKGKFVQSVKATTKGGKTFLKVTLKKGSPKSVTVTIKANARGDAGHDPASITNTVKVAR